MKKSLPDPTASQSDETQGAATGRRPRTPRRANVTATINPSIRDVLAGKRVSITDIDTQTAEVVAEAFRSAGAHSTISKPPEPDADVVVASPAAGKHVDPATPLLVLGHLDALVEWRRGSAHSDFLVVPPLRTDEVLLRAFRVLAGTRRPGPAAGATASVLAVDDDGSTTAIVRAVVTRSGMTCLVAANGRDALECARAFHPSLIVLDVNMPYIDGFEVLAALRNNPETGAIPVVMLTSVQQESDIVRGFGLGADDYVIKPFNPMELLARIKRILKSRAE